MLKEPDFKLIKSFAAKFTYAKNSLQVTITRSTKKRKMNCRLNSKALSCRVARTKKKHVTEELMPSSPSGQPICYAICPPLKKAFCFLAPNRRTPYPSRGGAAHPEHGWTETNMMPRERTRVLPPQHAATHEQRRRP
jgi:hypothetical protein